MPPVSYLTPEEVVALHEISIDEFGGSAGIRDMGLVESAVSQPQQSFGGEDLYPEIWDKAASIAWSISENQPFLDGNKRTAALSMLVFLDINGHEFLAKKGEIYKAIMKIAKKEHSRQQFSDWIKKNMAFKKKAD